MALRRRPLYTIIHVCMYNTPVSTTTVPFKTQLFENSECTSGDNLYAHARVDGQKATMAASVWSQTSFSPTFSTNFET